MSDKANTVGWAYETLRNKAINFEFKPGERLNESALTRELGISRTPMREALNRLVAEGFLTLSPGQGFYCRSLRPEKITELYQVRCALETEAVIRAIETASDADLSSLSLHLDETEATYFTSDDSSELARMDEEFHIELALRSGNQELVSLLTNVNERIRYVRIVNLRQLRMQDDRNEPKGLTAHR
ncbi:MAG: GntR family transcriptional regulator, partial [Geminicoccaceae bacterium]